VTARADRADRIRLALDPSGARWIAPHLADLLPPGSVVLTADEYTDITVLLNDMIAAGDVLATRLDETPVPSLFGFEDLDKAKEQQQAVRAWLALAHPDGEGHATEIGERGEVSGATWESATE
jgi:hypothetical protein